MLVLKIGIDVPRVPLLRLINEGLQKVAADAVLRTARLRVRQRECFLIATFVEEARHTTALRIDLDPYELIFETVGAGLQGRAFRSGFGRSSNEVCFVTHGRDAGQKQKASPMRLPVDCEQLDRRGFAAGIRDRNRRCWSGQLRFEFHYLCAGPAERVEY